jgi:hypothetical protein
VSAGRDSPLTGPPVRSVAELLARMEAIEQALPITDGLACFNRMYRLVTLAVQQHLSLDSFGDPVWMADLDVVFGNLYLSAVSTSVLQPNQVPSAWAALLERRTDARVTPLQFAFAGMNAHINHDLPIAVVTTCSDDDTSPTVGTHAADYDRVNGLLASVEPEVRESFEVGVLEDLDKAAPGLQDVVANFNIVAAREAAWVNAQTLWTLERTAPALAQDYLTGLDRLVGFAGRGLLVPLLPVGSGSSGPAAAIA